MSRERFARATTGLLTDLPHTTCDTIAAAVAGTSTERLPHLRTDADWDANVRDQQRVQKRITLRSAGGVFAIDDTTFPK